MKLFANVCAYVRCREIIRERVRIRMRCREFFREWVRLRMRCREIIRECVRISYAGYVSGNNTTV